MENEATTTQNAEETTATTPEETAPTEEKTNGEGKPEKTAEKTFTQSEVDKLIEGRLKRERKSADEKADRALAEITALKHQNACYKEGIRDDCVEDAILLAGKLVNEKTDFSAALKKVVEKYPAFKADGKSAVPEKQEKKTITTGIDTKNTSDINTDDKLRAAFGLKPNK